MGRLVYVREVSLPRNRIMYQFVLDADTRDRIVKPNLDSQALQQGAADSMDHQVVAASAAASVVVQWEGVLVQDARFMFPTFVPFPHDMA